MLMLQQVKTLTRFYLVQENLLEILQTVDEENYQTEIHTLR